MTNLEIETIDEEGNSWRLVMYTLPNKTNRFQLSFFFNEKEFELAKLQSIRSAQNLWELLSRIRKGDAYKKEKDEIKKFLYGHNAPKSEINLNNEVNNEPQIVN